MAKTITCDHITETVAELTRTCNLHLPEDVTERTRQSLERERSALGRTILADILKNHEIAAETGMPLCQDTGTAVVFLELGQEVHIEGGWLYDAVQAGVSRGYTENCLRASTMDHPWLRRNTGDNTPAVIHTNLVPGDALRITLMPKGGGAENYAALAMLTPAQGREGVKAFVVNCVKKAGPNACPPLVVGVGVGGNFEQAPILAKKALLRRLDEHNPRPEVQALEEELLEEINRLGIGPMGFGGSTTALAVAVEIAPCHIASLPVAVNLNCHVARHATAVL